MTHHRTPCTESADDREDKHRTPCIATDTSPRARTAPLWEGRSSASCPSSSTPLPPSPCPRLHHPRRGSLSRSAAKSTASLPARRGVQRPTRAHDRCFKNWRREVTVQPLTSGAFDSVFPPNRDTPTAAHTSTNSFVSLPRLVPVFARHGECTFESSARYRSRAPLPDPWPPSPRDPTRRDGD